MQVVVDVKYFLYASIWLKPNLLIFIRWLKPTAMINTVNNNIVEKIHCRLIYGTV
jgi:hypothetical protein